MRKSVEIPFDNYITPEQAHAFDVEYNGDEAHSLDWWQKRACVTDRCAVCEAHNVWRYSCLDMCFYCITGESDPSDYYELVQL